MRGILFLLVSGSLFLSAKIYSAFHFPFPPLEQLIWDTGEEFKNKTSLEKPFGSEGGFRDLGFLLLGMRRLAADMAWISVLQYFGDREFAETTNKDTQPHSHSLEGGKYPALKKMVLRVMRLDPSLHYATLYGAGAFGWLLNRPQEAMELLQEGIKNNPTYWQFRLYVGALLYREKGQFSEMIVLLEEAIQFPDCPTMIKSVLANIYKERKNYQRALEIWLEVVENEKTDAWYKMQAEKQIKELSQKLGVTFPQ